MKMDCHGYRDELLLMFRNESDHVITKAQKRYDTLAQNKKKPRATGPPKPWEPLPEWGSHSSSCKSDRLPVRSWNPLSQESITKPLLTPVESQALSFFFAHHKIEATDVLGGQYEFLVDMISRDDLEPVLQSSIRATSLACLANSTKSEALMKRARQAYGDALVGTNNALRSPESAVKDSTLVSVVLLGQYETFTFEGKSGTPDQAKHTAGACTLLSLRDRDNFKSRRGLQIFEQVYRISVMAAFQTDLVTPDNVTQMWVNAATSGIFKSVPQVWSGNMGRWVHEIMSISQDKTSSPATMVKRCVRTARNFEEFEEMVKGLWMYAVVPIDEPTEGVFGDCYHIYPEPRVASMWNMHRLLFFGLYHVLMKNLRICIATHDVVYPPEELQRLLLASEQSIRKISAEICASIPQTTGQIPFPGPLKAPPADASAPYQQSFQTLMLVMSSAGQSAAPVCLPCLQTNPLNYQASRPKLYPPGTFLNASRPTSMQSLVHPIWAAARHASLVPGLIDYAIDRLQFLAHTIGSKEPLFLANDLRQKVKDGTGLAIPPRMAFMWGDERKLLSEPECMSTSMRTWRRGCDEELPLPPKSSHIESQISAGNIL
jgi:hypothetical protein